MKINNFRGDLSDTSAKTATLFVSRYGLDDVYLQPLSIQTKHNERWYGIWYLLNL